jgi:hypothetical protein
VGRQGAGKVRAVRILWAQGTSLQGNEDGGKEGIHQLGFCMRYYQQ